MHFNASQGDSLILQQDQLGMIEQIELNVPDPRELPLPGGVVPEVIKDLIKTPTCKQLQIPFHLITDKTSSAR